MANYRNNNRKNRFKFNGDRGFRKRPSNGLKNHNDFNSNTEFKHRNPGRNNQNAAKLKEKYNNLNVSKYSNRKIYLARGYDKSKRNNLEVVNF